jgi:trans-2,3-dihydro-3-hydroxyanthranilate isomerase
MPYSYVIADVFTDQAYGGNPLAVVTDAEGLSTAQMQAIAKEFNLSETTFVTPGSAAGAFRVRIFTPAAELPFAGHPIVGTAVVLQSLGRTAPDSTVFELSVGPVRVELAPGRAVFFREGPPDLTPVPLPDGQIAALVGADRLAGTPMQAGYGTTFLMVPLVDRAAVAAAQLRREQWDAVAPALVSRGLYVHAVLGAADGVTQVHARMFAPALGVGEDPATGAAAAGLTGWLPGPDGLHRIAIAQGVEMGRPSLIHATATRTGGAVTGISIGGGAVVVGEGRLVRLP